MGMLWFVEMFTFCFFVPDCSPRTLVCTDFVVWNRSSSTLWCAYIIHSINQLFLCIVAFIILLCSGLVIVSVFVMNQVEGAVVF